MSEKKHCSCHNLTRNDFERACAAGCSSVRLCFRHLNCKPDCAECIPLVKAVLQEHADQQNTQAVP